MLYYNTLLLHKIDKIQMAGTGHGRMCPSVCGLFFSLVKIRVFLMWGFFAGCVRGVVLFHAFVFSDAFVMVLCPCFVTVSHGVGVIFAGRDKFFDSERATSVLCVLWGWAFAVSYMFWSRLRLTPLWPPGSGIPRFSDSGASLQRTLYSWPVSAPLLDSDRCLTA